MTADQNMIKKPADEVCPPLNSPTENHCVNCEYDGLREHRTLCLHPDSDTREFWTPTADNKCHHFVLWSKRSQA